MVRLKLVLAQLGLLLGWLVAYNANQRGYAIHRRNYILLVLANQHCLQFHWWLALAWERADCKSSTTDDECLVVLLVVRAPTSA